MASNTPPLPGGSKRSKGKPISSQEQQIILNVGEYFKKEWENGNKPMLRANAVIAKTAAATKFGLGSVTKILQAGKVIERRRITITRASAVPVVKLDSFDLGVIQPNVFGKCVTDFDF